MRAWDAAGMARSTQLSEVDLSATLAKKEAAHRLDAALRRLLHLRLVLGGQLGEHRIGPPLCVVFEGWDASGKGGAIKRLVSPLDPRHVRVAQFAAPTYDEKRHHFLWRFWPVLPGWGGMAVLDRSWYGRVLVERVEGFATEDQWERAYDEIVEFERTLMAEGMILVKFWMHVSAEEQLRRFRSRASTTRCGPGSSPTRTGATGRSGRSTRTPSRTCSSAPTTRRRRGTSSPATTSGSPGSRSWRRCARRLRRAHRARVRHQRSGPAARRRRVGQRWITPLVERSPVDSWTAGPAGTTHRRAAPDAPARTLASRRTGRRRRGRRAPRRRCR